MKSLFYLRSHTYASRVQDDLGTRLTEAGINILSNYGTSEVYNCLSCANDTVLPRFL